MAQLELSFGARVSGFLSADRKLGARVKGEYSSRPREKLSAKVKGATFPLGREETWCQCLWGKQGYVSCAVQLYGCHVDEVVRTTNRRINGNSKHTLLGPAPVKESICWVLNACSVDNGRYGNASRVRVWDGCGYGPYIVDGRLVVLK